MKSELRIFMLTTLIFLSGNQANAEGSPYPPPQNFMQLPNAAAGPHVQTIPSGKPAKFFALKNSHFPAPTRDTKDMKIVARFAPVAKDQRLPPEFDKVGAGKKTSMTQEQAKQIISIFASTQ